MAVTLHGSRLMASAFKHALLGVDQQAVVLQLVQDLVLLTVLLATRRLSK
jgi:hypothetical protein